MAGRYSLKADLKTYRDVLVGLGHTVTAQWLDRPLADDERDRVHALRAAGGDEESHEMARPWAVQDFEDVCRSNCLIWFAPGGRRGGSLNLPPIDFVEVWKGVANSRLGYEVSNLGRVRNSSGDLVSGHLVRGYRLVRPNGKKEAEERVHQLVAKAFIGPRPIGKEVDHKDGYKTNNWVGNLEYVTHLENIRRAEHLGLRGNRSGESNGRSKLTEDDVWDIRQRAQNGARGTKASLSREFGVSDTLISNIVNGKLWTVESDDGNTEFGMGIALNLRCIVVGPVENVFHSLPQVERYPTFEEMVARFLTEPENGYVQPSTVMRSYLDLL